MNLNNIILSCKRQVVHLYEISRKDKSMEIGSTFVVPSTYCYFSVAQSCPALCDPTDCSTPSFPVLHHLPEFAQTHVHGVGDAIQPSLPLSPSPPALNLSQHQGLF